MRFQKIAGGIIIPFSANGEPEIYQHYGPGVTILGWSAHDYCIYELEDAYKWAADAFRWLPIAPYEGVKGETKALATI